LKYFVEVDGREHEVELVERLGELSVRYDGEPVQVRYEEVDHLGQLAFFLGDRSFGVSIESDGHEAVVSVAGNVYDVRIEDERERAARAAEVQRHGGGGEVKSVMPGVVVDLLVAEGDVVVEGQPLLILEAMKMQNEITAPMAGRVTSIHAERGKAVGSGAKLLTLVADQPG